MPPIDEPIPINEAAFDAAVKSANVPVIVDFWADWCSPCRAIAPELARLAREQAGRALVFKVDTDRNPGLAQRFGVHAVPTLVVLRDGRMVHRQAGATDRGTMTAWIDSARRVYG